MAQTRIDHMQYLPDMEVLEESRIYDQVLSEMNAYNPDAYTSSHVERALSREQLSTEDFKALLSPAAAPFLEEMAKKAREETRKHFGNSVYLFTPLYISNYCENHCVYCGFNCKNKIRRAKLDMAQIEEEMKAIAATGLEEILILTGESRKMSDPSYIGEACRLASRYFKMVGLEVYPMNTEDYAYLHQCGADYVTVFQETYNPDKYETLHLAGHKRIFPYRFHAQERALKGGMRGVAFAALLGLDDFRKDALATGLHACLLQKKYPHAEISFSCPRLRPITEGPGSEDGALPSAAQWNTVSERQLLQIMCAYRLFLPFAGMTISTRERAGFRDSVIGLAATKISAGVSTGIGSHSETIEEQGDDQFEIADGRSLDEICGAIRGRGLQPVMNDYVFL